MKTQLNLRRRISFIGMLLVVAGMVFFSQCKEDEVTALDSVVVTGIQKVSTEDGSFRLDKSHSSINWKTAYIGDQAFLTGKFNKFDIDVVFDQEDLANSSISAWVVLSTCNTGEPGRDNLGKCLNGYLGVEHNGDTLSNGDPDPAGIIGSSDTARFVSSKIMRYGSQYKAIGMMSFKGRQHEVEVPLTYIMYKDYDDDPEIDKFRGSFVGDFTFQAKDINGEDGFGVTSTSINDFVHVNIQCIVRN